MSPAPPDQDPVIPGSLLRIRGRGVLISGDSGVGKTDLVLGLLDRGHALVADDAVSLRQENGRLHGCCPPALRGVVAVRGLGLLEVATVFGADRVLERAPLELVVELLPQAPGPDPLEVPLGSTAIMATAVPRLRLPTGPGRNLPLLIELAVVKLLGEAPAPAGSRVRRPYPPGER